MRRIDKYIIVFIISFLVSRNDCVAQITLDTTIMPLDGWGYDVYPIQISSTETKYLFADNVSNTFSLYNMDFTPYLTNIAVPEPFGTWTFQVLYVSKDLFDCDSTNIEYVYESSLGTVDHPFYIMRTDGTQLLRVDSAIGLYALGGILGSSEILRPIMNTSGGAKLFLHVPGGNGQATRIYSLCGTLFNNIFDQPNLFSPIVKLYPNPSASTLTFQIIAPNNKENFELVIVDSYARQVQREKINFQSEKYIIDVSNYDNGIYYYSICAHSMTYSSGRFIVNK